MRPNVTEVDLYSTRELSPAAPLVPDGSWLVPLCDPSTGISYKADQELIGGIISSYIGSGIVIPDRVYRIGVDMPAGSSVTVDAGQGVLSDPYLNGKVFSVNRRGTELLIKGVEWDNLSGDEIRLLQTDDIFSDEEIIIVQFQPQISPIISAPDAIARFTNGILIISSNTTLTASTYRKLLVLTGGYQVTLGSDYPENVICAFTQNSPGNGQSTISAPSGQSIAYNGTTVSSVWVGKNERVSFIRSGTVWYVVFDNLGYDRIGHIVPGRLIGANQIIGMGQTILRSDYPRALDYLNRLNAAYPGVVLSAGSWPSAKTYWGFGNGTTTIQVPDLRGYFPRWLDLGAGIDADRVSSALQNKPGSPEGMKVELHAHPADSSDGNIKFVKRRGTKTAGIATNPVNGFEYQEQNTGTYGGSETRPINAGELPLIFV